MNNISWFLYAVDVMASLSDLSEVILVIGGLVMCGVLVGIAAISVEKDLDERAMAILKIFKCAFKVCMFFIIPSLMVAVFIPSQKTMYLMLGSEVGEEAIQSDTGRRVHDAINKKLDEYLGEK